MQEEEKKIEKSQYEPLMTAKVQKLKIKGESDQMAEQMLKSKRYKIISKSR